MANPTTEFKLENSAHTIELDFRGSGFTYIGNVPTGGTITSLQINTGPAGGLSIAYKFSSMAVSVAQLVADLSPAPITHVVHYAAALNLFLGGNDVITGSNSATGDHLYGFGGNDTIFGRAGPDTMSGGGGNDTFVFKAGFGHDVITDFTVGATKTSPHDTIELFASTGLTKANVMAHASAATGHVVITDTAGDTITFNNLTMVSKLHAWDFSFHA